MSLVRARVLLTFLAAGAMGIAAGCGGGGASSSGAAVPPVTAVASSAQIAIEATTG
ncbi:MAG: hypothetical protein ACRETP_13935 [Steroidobacteraceae bacterium]